MKPTKKMLAEAKRKQKVKEKRDAKSFHVIGVSREDLYSIGIQGADKLTDNDMREIAQRLSESFCEGNANFWTDLETIAMDVYGLEQTDV